MKPLCIFFDRRGLEIGRTDVAGNLYPAKPGFSVDFMPDEQDMEYVELNVDWQREVFILGLEAAAKEVARAYP